jgi:hypothetical protein
LKVCALADPVLSSQGSSTRVDKSDGLIRTFAIGYRLPQDVRPFYECVHKYSSLSPLSSLNIGARLVYLVWGSCAYMNSQQDVTK